MAIKIEQLLELPAAERHRIAQLLWDSLPDDAVLDAIGLSAGEKREIDLALEEMERDPKDARPYEEIVAELRRQRLGP